MDRFSKAVAFQASKNSSHTMGRASLLSKMLLKTTFTKDKIDLFVG